MGKIGSIDWTKGVTKAARDNRANQLNPNNDAYWSSRGFTQQAEPSINSTVQTAVIATIASLATCAVIAAGVYGVHRLLKKQKGEKGKDIIEAVDFEVTEVD